MSSATDPHPVRPPSLGDAGVILRELRVSDLDALVEHGNDPQMARWIALPQPYTRADAETFLAVQNHGWSTGTVFHFAIESGSRLAGIIDVSVKGGGLGEVGYSLLAWARGQGLMTRGLRLAIPWVFGSAGMSLLHWRAEVGNWPSRRVAWAVGFTVETLVPGLLLRHGKRVDGWIAALRPQDALRPAHPWLEPAPITGERLTLRAHQDGDVPRMVQAARDPHSRRWLPGLPDEYTEHSAREHLDKIRHDQATGAAMHWAVADPGDDHLLGEMAMFIRDARDRLGEVGYWMHPDTRGRGLTTAAVRLACRHALLPLEEGGLGLNRVLLRAAAGNLASRRVAQKAGFTQVGLDRHADVLRDGTIVDDVRFDLLAAELPVVR